ADREEAEARARAAADAARERLGVRVVFAEGDVHFAEAVGKALVDRGLRLGCAESCTGGLVGQLLTERSGASLFFAGGIIAYENSVKTAVLGVPAELLQAHGAVSREVARSIAGIAGPEGGTAEKPVGLVHYAVAAADGTADKHFVVAGERHQVRLGAAYAAVALVLRIVGDGHGRPAEP